MTVTVTETVTVTVTVDRCEIPEMSGGGGEGRAGGEALRDLFLDFFCGADWE